MYWLSVASQKYAFCWKQGDLYSQGATMSLICTTYFIKSKSSLIKGIIILCSKKEKKRYKLNPDTISLSLGNFIFQLLKSSFRFIFITHGRHKKLCEIILVRSRGLQGILPDCWPLLCKFFVGTFPVLSESISTEFLEQAHECRGKDSYVTTATRPTVLERGNQSQPVLTYVKWLFKICASLDWWDMIYCLMNKK